MDTLDLDRTVWEPIMERTRESIQVAIAKLPDDSLNQFGTLEDLCREEFEYEFYSNCNYHDRHLPMLYATYHGEAWEKMVDSVRANAIETHDGDCEECRRDHMDGFTGFESDSCEESIQEALDCWRSQIEWMPDMVETLIQGMVSYLHEACAQTYNNKVREAYYFEQVMRMGTEW